MSAMIDRIVESDSQELAARLASDVASVLRAAISERGQASLVVSGGSTPLPMFECLAEEPDIDWAKVQITLADERSVPADHADSNEGFVHTHLLKGDAARAQFVSLLPDNVPAIDQLGAVAERIDAMGEVFDIVLLGMGGDGHTASLFPDASELEHAFETDVSVVGLTPPSVPQARISLSASRLLATRHLWLHITGQSKLAVLEDALDKGQLPIARLLDAAAGTDARRSIYQSV